MDELDLQDVAGSDARQAGIPSYVVGIGASAGGLESLEKFFKPLPVNTGMAFVVIQHLSPGFKSMMDELLARHTGMKIRIAHNGDEVRADVIYLLPANKEMSIVNYHLHLTDRDPNQGLTLPIDIFLRSLAIDCGPRAVGVILSGSGSVSQSRPGDVAVANV